MAIKVLKIEHHRNGVHGNGFHVVLFSEGRWPTKQQFVASVFAERGNIAILNVELLTANNIARGENSWRAEDYEGEIRIAILDYEASRALGPLSDQEIEELKYGRRPFAK